MFNPIFPKMCKLIIETVEDMKTSNNLSPVMTAVNQFEFDFRSRNRTLNNYKEKKKCNSTSYFLPNKNTSKNKSKKEWHGS